MMARIALALALLFAAAPAFAHSSSNSYLAVAAEGRALEAQWSIALRDLDYAIGLDSNGDGAVSWGEVRARAAAIDAYALPRLDLIADGAACAPGPVTHLADRLGDGGYVVLRWQAACPAEPTHVDVRYALFFDLDPQHRGLLRLTLDGATHAVALSPQRPDAALDARPGLLASFRTFFLAGIAHLLTGADHMLFVAMLLAPAMLRRRPARAGQPGWEAAPGFRPAFLEAVKVLSAFTLAHSLTLSCAALGYVAAPARLIECGIALTILATAIDNVRRVLPGRRWMLGFAFGLIHGFGFANSLGPLDLPPSTLAVALLAFNLGLEAAQLGLAALVLPLGFLARRTETYRRRVLPGVSAAAAAVALAWAADRAGDFGMMPF